MTDKYETIVLGSCNLEICIEDGSLAEKLLDLFPQGRKLYPIVEREQGNYLVRANNQFPNEKLQLLTEGKEVLEISKSKVKNVLAAGGGANAAKVIAKLGGKILFVTSIGREDDPNYQLMSTSLTEEPKVEFLNLTGRPAVGITLNVYGEGHQSTLLIYGGDGAWEEEEFKKQATQLINSAPSGAPIMAIALSQPYLPLLDVALQARGKVEHLCPSRFQINTLKQEYERYFLSTEILQVNIGELIDIYRYFSGLPERKLTEDNQVLTLLSGEIFGRWLNHKIATNSEKGGYFLQQGKRKAKRYLAYPVPGNFVDDTGCGDIFAGAFFWSYFLRKQTFEKSIEFAAACATFKIPSVGATGRLATREEVEDWVEKHGPKIQSGG